jgi:hypothetical protein
MDALQQFRRQVARELGNRQGAERRYSADLRHAAVAYWRTRKAAGAGLGAVATALGVAPVSLRRWAQDARVLPSYLHEHSGFSRASSRHFRRQGPPTDSDSDPGPGSARLLGRRTIRVLPLASERTGL